MRSRSGIGGSAGWDFPLPGRPEFQSRFPFRSPEYDTSDPYAMPNAVSARRRGVAALPSAPLSPYFSIVISYVFWAAVAVCAVAQLFIIAAAVRSKAPGRADAAMPHSSRAIEIGWTLVPALGLALLLFHTHRAIDSGTGQAPTVSVPTTRLQR